MLLHFLSRMCAADPASIHGVRSIIGTYNPGPPTRIFFTLLWLCNSAVVDTALSLQLWCCGHCSGSATLLLGTLFWLCISAVVYTVLALQICCCGHCLGSATLTLCTLISSWSPTETDKTLDPKLCSLWLC